ncbi:MAG: hypothetical protein NTX11_00820 [Candidatus Saccharibacteria bacterium]|nr:hypothetical protein [Candidatus Saccharibacteria bacterium]
MTPEAHPTREAHITDADLHSTMISEMVYDELVRQASGHTSRASRFVPLEFNPRDMYRNPNEGNPGQLLADYCITPDAIDGIEDFIHAAAETFLPGFSGMVEKFRDAEHEPLLDSLIEKLDANENVLIATNHGEIYDIAIILSAIRVALAGHLAKQGREPIESDRFNIIVHRMISQLGVADDHDPSKIAPALSVLKLVGEIYLSFPNTETSKKARLPPGLSKYCNKQMLSALSLKLSMGGQILAIAPSGSKDESVRDRLGKPRKVIKPVNSGTFALMQADKTWVLGVGVSLDQKNGPSFSVSDLKQCKNDDDCREVLNSIAAHHSKLTGIKTVFAERQSDMERLREEAAEVIQTTSEKSHISPETLVKVGVAATALTVGFLLGRRSKKR